MKSHMSKSEHIRQKASAPSPKARARASNSSACVPSSCHALTRTRTRARTRTRTRTHVGVPSVGVGGGWGRRSPAAAAHDRTGRCQHVCARSDVLGSRCARTSRSSRRTRIAPARRRGSCARPADSEDATLGEAPAPLAHGPVRRAPALAARSLKHASEAAAHMPARAHARRHDASTSC